MLQNYVIKHNLATFPATFFVRPKEPFEGESYDFLKTYAFFC